MTVTLSGRDGARQVAQHERCWARHQTITDPQHQQAAAAMRAELSRQHRQPTPHGQQVEQRPLADYDAAFGLATVKYDAAAVA